MNNDANNSEARLSQALRSLATTSPCSAPPEMGDALAQAFRRHHARRRVVRRTTITAAIVILLALPVALVLSRRQGVETPGQNAGGTVTNARSPLAVHPDPPLPKRAPRSRPRLQQRPAATSTQAAARRDDFVPLPSYGLRNQAEDLRIVRLQVNGRALRLVGAPVSGDIDERPVLADFVVGQDGTPYAVRLLRQNVR